MSQLIEPRAFSYDGGSKLYDLVYGVLYSYLQIEQALYRLSDRFCHIAA